MSSEYDITENDLNYDNYYLRPIQPVSGSRPLNDNYDLRPIQPVSGSRPLMDIGNVVLFVVILLWLYSITRFGWESGAVKIVTGG